MTADRWSDRRARSSGSSNRTARWRFASWLVRTVASAAATLLVISALVFLSLSVIGGDSVTAHQGMDATDQTVAAAREQLGLDRPLIVQYLNFLGGLVRGDLGVSAASVMAQDPVPVKDLIAGPFGNSMVLALLSFALIAPLSLMLGAIAGYWADRRTDRVVSSVVVGLAALPEFVLATLLIYVVFYKLNLLTPLANVPPGVSPLADPSMLVLPVLTLVLPSVAVATRQVRSGVLEVMRSPYTQTARLNGYSETAVFFKVVLRNSLPAAVQVLALTFVFLVGGIVIVEQVFAYPGIGQVMLVAVSSRDASILQGSVMVVGALCILVTTMADVLVTLLVPRLRTSA